MPFHWPFLLLALASPLMATKCAEVRNSTELKYVVCGKEYETKNFCEFEQINYTVACLSTWHLKDIGNKAPSGWSKVEMTYLKPEEGPTDDHCPKPYNPDHPDNTVKFACTGDLNCNTTVQVALEECGVPHVKCPGEEITVLWNTTFNASTQETVCIVSFNRSGGAWKQSPGIPAILPKGGNACLAHDEDSINVTCSGSKCESLTGEVAEKMCTKAADSTGDSSTGSSSETSGSSESKASSASPLPIVIGVVCVIVVVTAVVVAILYCCGVITCKGQRGKDAKAEESTAKGSSDSHEEQLNLERPPDANKPNMSEPPAVSDSDPAQNAAPQPGSNTPDSSAPPSGGVMKSDVYFAKPKEVV